MEEIYTGIWINGLQVLGGNDCPYTSNIYNLLYDITLENNDSENFYDGQFSGTSRYTSKTFTIVVTTKTPNGIRSKLDTKHKMQIKHACSKGEIPIIVEEEQLGKLYCKAKLESITTDDNSIMTLTFKQLDPYIYSYETKSIELEKVMEGGFYFDDVNGFSIDDTKGFYFNETLVGNTSEVINEGFATIYPVIEIEGEASNIVITNETTKEKLTLNLTMTSEDKLYIDCSPFTRCIKLNGTNAVKYKSGNYISLIEGSNVITIDYQGDCSVTINWREAW